MINKGFIDKLTFEQKSKGDNRVNNEDVWKKNFQEEGTAKTLDDSSAMSKGESNRK